MPSPPLPAQNLKEHKEQRKKSLDLTSLAFVNLKYVLDLSERLVHSSRTVPCCILFAMASFRRYADEFYSQERVMPKKPALSSFFSDSLIDLELRITRKLFDMNRTLTRMATTQRRVAELENVHLSTFEAAFFNKAVPRQVATFTSLHDALQVSCSPTEDCVETFSDQLSAFFFDHICHLQVLPAHSLVRRHPAGDICLILPLSVARENLDVATDINGRALHYGVRKGEIFCPLDSCADDMVR